MLIKSKAQLAKELKKRAKSSLDTLSEHVAETWSEHINREFYQQYEPKTYQRTEQMLHSPTSTGVYNDGDGLKSRVFMDTTGVRYEYGGNAQQIWNWAAGGYHGNPKLGIKTPGWFYWEVGQDIEQGDYQKKLKEILKEEGLSTI